MSSSSLRDRFRTLSANRRSARRRQSCLEWLETRLAPATGLIAGVGFSDVAAATPTFSALAAPTITYGTPSVTLSGNLAAGSQIPPGLVTMSVGSLNVSAAIDPGTGNFSTTLVTSALGAASSPYTITYAYAGSAGFSPASATAALTVNKATPALSWNTPGDIPSGTALDSTQLDALTAVPGTYTYTPAAGTVLPVGSGQPLSVSFQPTDSADYNAATASVNINVNAGTNGFDTLSAPTILYGTQTVSISGHIAFGASVPTGNVAIAVGARSVVTPINPTSGDFAGSISTATLSAAASPYTISFAYPGTNGTTPTNTATSTLTVLKTNPVLTWNNPADIPYGMPLGSTQLNASASVLGTFTYTQPAGTVLPSGTGQTLGVVFQPTDSADYNPAAASVAINVIPPSMSFDAVSSATIVYGTPSTTLTGHITTGSTVVPPGTVTVSAGNQSVSAAIDPNTGNFSATLPTSTLGAAGSPYTITYAYAGSGGFPATSATGTLTVHKADSILTWKTPADMVYGAALDATQLDATASVPGTFTYTPPAGTVLPPGAGQTLSVSFQPTDSADYNAAADSVKVNVNQVSSNLDSLSSPTISYGTPSVTLSGHIAYAGVVPPGSVTIKVGNQSVSAPIDSNTGNFSAPLSSAALGVSTSPYTVTYSYAGSPGFPATAATTVLTVTKANPTLVWTNPGDIAYGTALGSTQLNAAGSVPGTFTYTPASGTVLPAGAGQTLSVGFQPTDSADYNPATASVKINVTPAAAGFSALAAPTITYGTLSATFSGNIAAGSLIPPGFVTISVAGTQVVAPIDPSTGNFSTFIPTGTLGVASSPYTITYAYAGSANFAATSATAALTVTPATPYMTWNKPGDIVAGTAIGFGLNTAPVAWNPVTLNSQIPGTITYSPPSGTVLPAGANQPLTATFQPTDSVDYTSATVSTTINVDPTYNGISAQTSATVTAGGWNFYLSGHVQFGAVIPPDGNGTRPYVTVTVGSLTGPLYLSNGYFNGAIYLDEVNVSAASSPYTITYSYPGAPGFPAATATGVLTVLRDDQRIDWSPQSVITYGTPLGPNQLNATAYVPGFYGSQPGGTLTYSLPAGTILPAGQQVLTVAAAETPYGLAAIATQTITVLRATPTITWANPADIPYGTPLGAAQLDATASVPGTFTYSKPAGTVLPAGSGQTLSVTFKPTDSNDYNSVTASVKINVTPTTPAFSGLSAPTIAYGTPSVTLSGNLVMGSLIPPGSVSIAVGDQNLSAPIDPNTGNFSVTLPTSTLGAASSPYTITYAYAGSTGFPATSATTTLTVDRATPILTWYQPADITSGTPLGPDQLDATASVPGTFVYTPAAGIVLNAGSGQVLAVQFQPDDAADYNAVTDTTTINVTASSPSFDSLSAPTIVYGTPSTTLSGHIAGAVAPSGSVTISVGSQSVSAPIDPSTGDFSAALDTASLGAASSPYTITYAYAGTSLTATTALTVNKATPVLTWTPPASIVYGTPLSATQLDAALSAQYQGIAGHMAYWPTPGTVLWAGANQTLYAGFVPDDTADYNIGRITTTLSVTPATLTIHPVAGNMGHGNAVPTLTYTLGGFVNGDTAGVVHGSAILRTTATSNSAAGLYPITAAAGTLSALNYRFVAAPGVMVVHPKVLDVRVHFGNQWLSLRGLSRDLPFIDINAIDVLFSDNVSVSRSSLTLRSLVGARRQYSFPGFSYNAATHAATWALPSPIGIDRLLLALNPNVSASGNSANRIWNDPVLALSVLPGDVTGDGVVTSFDAQVEQALVGRPVIWADLDGSGLVNVFDVNAAKQRNGTRLP